MKYEKTILLLGILSVLCSEFISCKKHESSLPATDTVSLSEEDSLKYLMYRIMQVSFVDGGRDSTRDLPTYYWYSQVPEVNPLSSSYADAEDLLSTIIGYPTNMTNGKAIDRYSFLDRTGSLSDEIQNGVVDGVFSDLGIAGSFGLEVTYVADQQGESHLFVLYADKNSPAGRKGVSRGWEITAVNGDTDISYDGQNGANTTRVINAVYKSEQTSFTFKKPDNSRITYTLNAASYTINPVLFDSIYTINNKKVGYFVFYIFTNVIDDEDKVTATKKTLDKLFDKFKEANISDLIVDLRYNGGGAIGSAEYLDSAIAPATANGKVMYKYIYNDKLSSKEDLLGLSSKVYFPNTGGGLNLDHVFFIVSRNTASASELTLNNLKPYMDVLLVGDTTYGKPVGFIDFNISVYDSTGAKKYLADLYAINFATQNANGEGGYFEGIPPDVMADDYVNIPWGNLYDDNLRKIFNYISTGSFTRSYRIERKNNYREYSTPVKGIQLSPKINGMINYKMQTKLNVR